MKKDRNCEAKAFVNNLETCQLAVRQIKNQIPDAHFRERESVYDWPKGCYMYLGGTVGKAKHGVFFNAHRAGTRHEDARPICQIQGMK